MQRTATQPRRWPSACAFETLVGDVGWIPPLQNHPKTPIRPHSAPRTMPSTPKAQRDDPITPTTPGASVVDRYASVLAGYHPSRRPVGTARDRAQIGTKTARTSPEWIPGLRLPRRGAQGGVAPPATEYCGRRSGGGLQNAILAFQPPWYKLETP